MNVDHTMGTPMPAGSLTASYTGTAGTTTAVSADAKVIRVMTTTDAFIEITTAGTAAAANTGMYMPAFTPEYFSCPGSVKVSAIQVASAGSVYVTPFA